MNDSMTVGDLIDALEEYDREMPVAVTSDTDWTFVRPVLNVEPQKFERIGRDLEIVDASDSDAWNDAEDYLVIW